MLKKIRKKFKPSIKLKKENKSLRKEISYLRKEISRHNLKLHYLQNQFNDITIENINAHLKDSKCRNIILSTYPKSTTKNVGDAMITESFKKLLIEHGCNQIFIPVFRDINLDKLDLKYVKNILAPGFSVAPSSYPKKFSLFSDLNKLHNFNFIPFGCSYQNYLPHLTAFDPKLYTNNDRKFLSLISELSGNIPCRDIMIKNLLNNIGINSYYCGDLVLYDPKIINKQFTNPKKIRSVAMSVQHKKVYLTQSIKLLKKIKNYFAPETNIYVTFHGIEDIVTNTIKEEADMLNIKCINLSGNFENLKFYENIDIHIGYRLHGHIYCLRKRKPSILIVEDARAYGFSQTSHMGVGCFQGLNDNKKPDELLEEKIFEFIDYEKNINFSDYSSVFKFIDDTYVSIVAPRIREIAKLINATQA